MFKYIDESITNLSLYSGRSAVWTISKIIGLAPFTPENQSYQLTILNIIFTIICSILYFLCFLYSILINYETPSNLHYPVICMVGHFMHIYLGCFLCMEGYLLSALKGGHVFRFFKELNHIDLSLKEISGKENPNIKTSIRFQFVMVISGLLIFLVVTVFDFLIFYQLYGNMVFLINLAYIFPYINASVVLAQFNAIIYIVYMRFKEINSSLNYIATAHEVTSKAVKMYKGIDELSILSVNTATPILFMTNMSSQNPSTYSNKKEEIDKITTPIIKKQLIDDVGQQDEDPRPVHKDMEQLFTLHDQLLDMSEAINKIYSLQIVTFIIVSFIIILFGFFFETKVIFLLWGKNTFLILIATSYICWGILTAIVIYLLLTICTRCKEEAYESALIVHKILQNKPSFMLNDEIYYNKMKSFTLQVLHRKNTFHFNALGLFRLDYTFIFSVVSAATSYLIVLLQFDLSSDLEPKIDQTE